MDDSTLVNLARSEGDLPAFSELVARHQGHLRALLRYWLGGDRRHEADDLAQETFLQAHRKLASFRGDADFVVWLRRIAYREFLQHCRRARPKVSLDDPNHPPDERLAPESTAGFRHDVLAALAQLPDDERTAVVCCCLQGWSQEEAAELMGKPLGTLKSLTFRGRQKLRSLLAEWAGKATL